MTDRADLIRRLKEAAEYRHSLADLLDDCTILDGEDIYENSEHRDLAALLREAVKALEIEEATRNQHNVIYGPAGKAP